MLGPVLDLFDADTIEVSTLLDGKTGRRGLYALPMGRISNYVHVWNSLLERAGFTLADIPQEWEAFWSFWCDRVQPAVRKAIGREDIWAVGLPMSVAASMTPDFELTQFQLAYQASWLSMDRRVQVDDPAVREGMVRALAAYTEIWRKGCTPPGSVSWTNVDNNKAFLAQTVVMTPNPSLSIPAALQHSAARRLFTERRHDRMAARLPTASRSCIEGHCIAPWSSRMAAMAPPPSSSSASSPRRAGSPIG